MNTKQQNQTNYYDYGFRQFDAQLGRWHVVDAMAEKYFSQSPYNYVGNDPVSRTDFMGLTYYYKRIEWEKESHFSGGIMDFINNMNNHMRSSFSHSSGYYSLESAFQSSHTKIEGVWVNNNVITSVDMIKVRELVKDGFYITFVPVGDDIAVIGSIGELGGVEIENGAITTSSNSKAGTFVGFVTRKGWSLNKTVNDINNTLTPVAYSFEGTGSTEAGGASNASPWGGIYITRGPDEGNYKNFSSAGVGVGALGASAMVVATKYYYVGDINNFRMDLFEQTTINVSISVGEILQGAGNVNVTYNPRYPSEFLIGVGVGIGVGLDLPLPASGQITWQKTHIYWE